MDSLIANTFTHGIASLTGDEHKVVKPAGVSLRLHLTNPGMRVHQLDKGRDRRS